MTTTFITLHGVSLRVTTEGDPLDFLDPITVTEVAAVSASADAANAALCAGECSVVDITELVFASCLESRIYEQLYERLATEREDAQVAAHVWESINHEHA